MSFGGLIRRYTFWLSDFFKGQPIWTHFNDIKNILNNYDYSIIKQQEYLNCILNHAVNNSKFYSHFKNRSLESFPVMNKQSLRENYDFIKIDIKKIPGQKGEIHIQRTSGSTGNPFAVPQDTRKRNRRIAELKYFGEIAGYKSHEKLVQIKSWKNWLYKKSKFQLFRENIFQFYFHHLNDDMFQGFSNLIRRKKISTLYGYPNWFEMFVDFIERKSIKIISINVVIAISEMLLPTTRKKLKNLLNCKIVSRYSNEEQGILGQDRDNDEKFYLNHASYFFEFLKLKSNEKAEPGEISRIVVTDLFNYAFPFIRYDTGDTCTYTYINKLNKNYPVLSKIYGRTNDIIYDANGQPVHPFSFSFLKNYDEVLQWQFIQKDSQKYILKLRLSREIDLKHCTIQLKKIVGDNAKITIELVDDIPVLSSGKRKPVICEIKNE